MLLQAHKNGVVLKSAAQSGTIMTRCMIRADFFADDSFQIELAKDGSQAFEEGKENDIEQSNKVLIEFCLPFTELKHIVDSMEHEENMLELEYPVGDSYLQIKIPEESTGIADNVKVETAISLNTYEAQHSLDADFSFSDAGVCAQFWVWVWLHAVLVCRRCGSC